MTPLHRILFTSTLLLLSLSNAWACSCTEFPAFCERAIYQDVFIGRVVAQDIVNANNLNTPFTTIAILLPIGDTQMSSDTISLLSQNGLNCNDDISGYLPGDSLLISINVDQVIEWEDGSSNVPNYPSFDLFGCGRYFLPVENGMVGGLGVQLVALGDFLAAPFNNCPRPIVSTEEPVSTPQLQAFPNPTNASVWLSYRGRLPLNLTLYNSQGQLLQRLPLNTPQQELPLTDLPAGLYFLREEAGPRSKILRIIKY